MFLNLSLGSFEGGEKSTGKLADAVHPGWRMNRCPRLEMIKKLDEFPGPETNYVCVTYNDIYIHKYTYIYMYAIYMYIYMCVYYISTYIYIYTYVHIYI